jgi:hypothetical protein
LTKALAMLLRVAVWRQTFRQARHGGGHDDADDGQQPKVGVLIGSFLQHAADKRANDGRGDKSVQSFSAAKVYGSLQ